MESLENLTIDEKKDILYSWIRNMDENDMNELLIEYFDYECLLVNF